MASQAQYQQPPSQRRRDSEPPQQKDDAPARRREPERVFPDPKTGLTAAQAADFLEQGLGNEMAESNAKSTKQKLDAFYRNVLKLNTKKK